MFRNVHHRSLLTMVLFQTHRYPFTDSITWGERYFEKFWKKMVILNTYSYLKLSYSFQL
jgi:hypothetical protein